VTITGLQSSTAYDFDVVANNSFGQTASSTVSVATLSSLTINSIALSDTSFNTGSPIGTLVGNVTVTTTGGSFIGMLTVTGTDAAFFQIVGNQLQLASASTSVRSYNINIVATQSSASDSPFTQAFSISGVSGESAEATTVTTAGPTINASTTLKTAQPSGPYNVFALTSGSQISLNGVVQSNTGNVVALFYHDNTIFQHAVSGSFDDWWYWSPAASQYVEFGYTVALSTTTYTQGATGGTVVGQITVTMSDASSFASWGGALSLSGTNASSFTITGSASPYNLVVASGNTLGAGSYNITITASILVG
jgi:hypothetical protein